MNQPLLFMLGLVMLLASLYKITNYNRIDEIRVHRIEKQFCITDLFT